jgi:hypothetical protein
MPLPFDEYATPEAFRQRHMSGGLSMLAKIMARRG